MYYNVFAKIFSPEVHMKNFQLKKLILAAVFAAIICVVTLLLPIPLPGSGYANLGDTLIAVASVILGPLWGAVAAGLGSALADVFLGYTVYAPATFIIKGAMAVVYYFIFRPFAATRARIPMSAVASLGSEALMIGGYFAFEAIIYSPAAALPNIWGNLTQGLVATVVSTVVISILSHNANTRKLLAIKK